MRRCLTITVYNQILASHGLAHVQTSLASHVFSIDCNRESLEEGIPGMSRDLMFIIAHDELGNTLYYRAGGEAVVLANYRQFQSQCIAAVSALHRNFWQVQMSCA